MKEREKKFVFGSDDALFGSIEKQQGEAPFGDFLDAGTGLHSLRWMATLESKGLKSFTAITADKNMQEQVQEEADHLGVLEGNHVIIGNWFGKLELPMQQYDTILADYLIGAMDGFSPFKQDQMIPMLVKLLKPGGKLFIVGLQPIPDKADGPANIVCKVRQVRDACILLAGHRCYREYPVEWVQTQCQNIPELQLLQTHKFPITYRHATVVRQINVGRSKFSLFPTRALVSSMREVLHDLERQSKEQIEMSPTGKLTLGFDYIVSVEKKA